ncbi:hypothetical protein Poly51_62840 [Rubripirellula tenax]|uniref:Uncharacterized protein n=1 Tax=Rubripirellula tenax TaxID=2528015 RepID=A0A5C6E8R8_9BACT|nr:hypothetical protein [Rubripirellula tenax]TWU43629.1 hypothetical protein Poly51_62840 [Rubripirellula tenax]
MDQELPVCTVHRNAQSYADLVMRSMTYDCDRLTVYLQGRDFGFVRVAFDNPRGFRLLDEGDLCSFWEKYHTGNGWLYEVQSGGWLDLESTRADFLTPHMYPNGLVEYLLVCDKCISVLTSQKPDIIELGKPPGDAETAQPNAG